VTPPFPLAKRVIIPTFR